MAGFCQNWRVCVHGCDMDADSEINHLRKFASNRAFLVILAIGFCFFSQSRI